MTKRKNTVLAWHWIAGDKLRDGTTAPKDGKWLEYKGPLKMCESGLHASRNPFDALQYAPGATLCLVECDGIGAEQPDKLVCSRRRIIVRMDATELCRYFARQSALSVSHLWADADDPDDTVLEWLVCGDEAQRASVWDSARASVWDSAWVSAWASAWVSARGAAWDSAWASARGAFKNEFTQLVYECFEDYL